MNEIERNRLERLLALLCIGICEAVKDDAITIDEAEKMLFSPKIMILLKEARFEDAIISAIHSGTELDNIRDIIPEHFLAELDKLKQEAMDILFSTPPSDPELTSWLKKMF